VSGTWVDIRFTLPANTVDGGYSGGLCRRRRYAMRAVLAIAAGVDGPESLPSVTDGTATLTVSWDPEKVADHTGVTAPSASRWRPASHRARRARRSLLASGFRGDRRRGDRHR